MLLAKSQVANRIGECNAEAIRNSLKMETDYRLRSVKAIANDKGLALRDSIAHHCLSTKIYAHSPRLRAAEHQQQIRRRIQLRSPGWEYL